VSASVQPHARQQAAPPATLTALPAVPESVPQQDFAMENMLQEFRLRKARPISRTGANFTNAIEAVSANKTRSLLTMLAIFIGVAAVVAVFILTQGATAYFTNQILSQGATSITIDAGIGRTRGPSRRTTGRQLSFEDYQAVTRLPSISASSPIFSSSGGQAVYQKQNWKTRVSGVSPDYENMASWDMAQGLWFNEGDNASARPVVVIGDTVYQNLFVPLNINPIGQSITYRGQPLKVIGVLAPKGGFNLDDVIFTPYNTVRYRLSNNPTNVDEIIVQTTTSDSVNQTVRAIQRVLEHTHHIAKGIPDDFTITTADQLLQQVQQGTSMMTTLLVGIAAISLTVGGIGVMNIMIVSVTERTREIGIRMSMGAKRSDIRSQFLMEALVLCIVGGILGLLVGLAAGYKAATSFSFPFVITPTTFILPFAVSSTIGLVFGLIPAIRASRLDPIMALRRAK